MVTCSGNPGSFDRVICSLGRATFWCSCRHSIELMDYLIRWREKKKANIQQFPDCRTAGQRSGPGRNTCGFGEVHHLHAFIAVDASTANCREVDGRGWGSVKDGLRLVGKNTHPISLRGKGKARREPWLPPTTHLPRSSPPSRAMAPPELSLDILHIAIICTPG